MAYFNATKAACMLVPASWKHYMTRCSTEFGQDAWKPIANHVKNPHYISNARKIFLAHSCAVRNSAQNITSSATANNPSQEAWVVGIFWAVFVFLVLFYTPDMMSAMDSVITWAKTLRAWDVKTMDPAVVDAAVKAAWPPVFDEDGNAVLPAFVKEHLEKRGLAIPIKSTRSSSDVETKMVGSFDVKSPHDVESHTFATPSWFPFRVFFRFQARPFFIGFASRADWLQISPTLETSLLEMKNAEIAALKAELEDTLMELDDKSEEMQGMKILIAQKVEGQRVDLAAAHKDVDAIRMRIRKFAHDFRKTGAVNKIQAEQIKTLKKKVQELSITNEILTNDKEDTQRLSEEIQRENENWIKTMHALHDSDKSCENERLKEQLYELQASHNRIALSNLTLKDMTAYVQRISATNAEAVTITQTKLDNALWNAEGLREELSTTEEKLQTALHEVTMLRSELSDQEKALDRLSTASSHDQAQLSSQLEHLHQAATTKQAQLSHALGRKTRLLCAIVAHDGVMARRYKALAEALRSEKQHSADLSRELAWLQFTDAEATRYPQWESAGFADEGFETGDSDEAGYASADTLELSGSEGGSDSEFEEVVLSDSMGGFERGQLLFRRRGEERD
ncbi:uncharacterized protein EKO05_0002183 [Ascochyta rabiei]|uniref:Uncharacterized protein n=1 Tax=Didymella rabiei TaxID=5454 RepID=A0A163JFR2_DIDRA|nr:uncharacterized protein EKO05_0002183 [Ascochyta rabiei]KZM26332.1 hypothetical protein ST47_g2548 [Ascochyta rabiei]UPX11585.1 hypothetical protein EKO05_0002183 [Ascochyta rabiei]